MTDRKKATAKARAVIDSLLDGPPDDHERETAVEGIDVAAFASRLRGQVEAHFAGERKKAFEEVERERMAELARLQTQQLLLDLPHDQLVARLSRLVTSAGPTASLHYMKYEEATKEEIAEMIRSLEHLVEDESE